jgi:hypothetical protein
VYLRSTRGLGIRSLKEFNDALLLKWAIRIFEGENKLWANLIRETYGESNTARNRIHPVKASPFRKSVTAALKENWNFFKPICGDGRNFRFWEDEWSSIGVLQEKFPRVYG